MGAVAVSEPLGTASEVGDLVLARYAFAAMELLPFDAEGNFEAPEPAFTPVSTLAFGA